MRIGLVLLALITAACAVPPHELANAPTATPSTRLEAYPSPAPSTEPLPSASPAVETTPSPAVHLESPTVVLSPTAFPLVASLGLRAAPIDAEAEAVVHLGLERYLESLDRFRESGAMDRSQLWLSGRFGDAVFAGLSGSATPGVKRKFEIGAFKIDRLLVKPWG